MEDKAESRAREINFMNTVTPVLTRLAGAYADGEPDRYKVSDASKDIYEALQAYAEEAVREAIKKYDKECVKKCDLIIQRTIERKKEISDLERDNQELKDILNVKDGEIDRLRKENEELKLIIDGLQSTANKDIHGFDKDGINILMQMRNKDLRTLLERAKEVINGNLPSVECCLKTKQLLKDLESI